MSITFIQKAVEVLGTQAALAQAIGVSQPLVSRWQRGEASVSAEYVLKIETATGGEVKRHDLRPDIYPPPPSSVSV